MNKLNVMIVLFYYFSMCLYNLKKKIIKQKIFVLRKNKGKKLPEKFLIFKHFFFTYLYIFFLLLNLETHFNTVITNCKIKFQKKIFIKKN